MAIKRVRNTTLLRVVLLAPLALAAAPAQAREAAAIEYANGSAPQLVASLESLSTPASRAPSRGPLTPYDYGARVAPASGPTIDLRGKFADAPFQSTRTHAATPASPAAGPVDIRPPAIEAAAFAPVSTLEASEGNFVVQVGAFSLWTNAERTKERVSALGGARVDTVERGASTLYRVRFGSWPTRADAESARDSAIALGFADARVTTAD